MASPAPTATFVRAEFYQEMQGQSLVNVLTWWGIETPRPPNNAIQAADDVLAHVWQDNWEDAVSSALRLTRLHILMGEVGGNPAGWQQYDLYPDWTGSRGTSAFLPPWICAGIRLIPSNDPVWSDDADAPNFTRPAVMRISGLLEDDIDGGNLSSSGQSLFNAFGETLEEITIDGHEYILTMRRPPDTLVGGNVSAETAIAETSVRVKLSSMLSRKY